MFATVLSVKVWTSSWNRKCFSDYFFTFCKGKSLVGVLPALAHTRQGICYLYFFKPSICSFDKPVACTIFAMDNP